MWYGYGVILTLGILTGLYYFWRMGRDEHWDEIAIFDAFFLSLLAYLLAGRIVYTGFHQADLNTLGRAMAILTLPGVNVMGGLGGAITTFLLIAKVREWELWKAADLLAVFLLLILVFGAGAAIVVNPEAWVRGVVNVVLALVGFGTVLKVKKNFRFYQWYKGEESVARDGLAASLATLLGGVYLLLSLIGGALDYVRLAEGVVVTLLGIYAIMARRGRKKVRANALS